MAIHTTLSAAPRSRLRTLIRVLTGSHSRARSHWFSVSVYHAPCRPSSYTMAVGWCTLSLVLVYMLRAALLHTPWRWDSALLIIHTGSGTVCSSDMQHAP